MVKILIADTDIQRNSASCQFLANEKGFEIESTNDGSSTIKKYLEIEPNIFILDSNFTDIKTLEIIDRLYISPIEKRKKYNFNYKRAIQAIPYRKCIKSLSVSL